LESCDLDILAKKVIYIMKLNKITKVLIYALWVKDIVSIRCHTQCCYHCFCMGAYVSWWKMLNSHLNVMLTGTLRYNFWTIWRFRKYLLIKLKGLFVFIPFSSPQVYQSVISEPNETWIHEYNHQSFQRLETFLIPKVVYLLFSSIHNFLGS
jgi:hypothetical protein